MSSSLRRRWLWGFLTGVVLAVPVVGFLVFWSGAERFSRVFSTLSPVVLLGATALASFNFLIRFIRWQLLLSRVGAHLPAARSLWIFLSGLAFTITPGKSGEAFKSVFCSRFGIPPSRTLAVVWVERFFDLVSVILLFSAGLVFWPGRMFWFAVPMWLTAGLLMLLVYTEAGRNVLRRRLVRFRDALDGWFRELDRLRSPALQLGTLVISMLGWLAEGVAFWWILHSLGVSASVPLAMAIYFAGTLAGVFFPGGLLGTEGMMVLLLSGLTTAARLSVAVVAIRLTTLWWATLVGLVAVLSLMFRDRNVVWQDSSGWHEGGKK